MTLDWVWNSSARRAATTAQPSAPDGNASQSGSTAKVVDVLLPVLAHPDAAVRVNAIEALWNHVDDRLVAPMVTLVRRFLAGDRPPAALWGTSQILFHLTYTTDVQATAILIQVVQATDLSDDLRITAANSLMQQNRRHGVRVGEFGAGREPLWRQRVDNHEEAWLRGPPMLTAITDRPWVRWTLRIATVALILYLGFTIRQLRDQRQHTRSLAANTLWFSIDHITQTLTVVEQRLVAGDVTTALRALRQSHAELAMAVRSVDTYQGLITPPQGANRVKDSLRAYTVEPYQLWAAVEGADTPQPANLLPAVTALRLDLERWQAAFPEDLLATGSRDNLAAAARSFCQGLQVTLAKFTCYMDR